jgi:hypothetical protein
VIAASVVQQTASRCSECVPDQTVTPGFGFSQAVRPRARAPVIAAVKTLVFNTSIDYRGFG